MTAQERITEWAELADNATEGPWDAYLPHPAYRRYAVERVVNGYLSGDGTVVVCEDVKASENSEFIAASRTAVPAMAAALTAVLERHRPIEVEPSDTICSDCSFRLPNGRFFGKIVEWPCPTVAAIETALEVTA